MSSIKIKLYLPGKENIRRFSLDSKQTLASFAQVIQPFQKNETDVISQYEDEEGDWITFTTEFEFQECLRNHDKLSILRIRLVAPAKSKKGKEVAKKPAGKYVWEWQDKKRWVAYDEKTSQLLEKAHAKGTSRLSLALGGKPYTISLTDMTQQNVETQYCRTIRRVAESKSKKAEVQAPLNVGANDTVVDVTDAIRHLLPAQLNNILSNAANTGVTEVPFIHKGITCDGCGSYPIIGIRHKCQGCADYDLCQKCHANKDKIHNHDHAFLAIHQGKPSQKYDKIVTHIIYEDDNAVKPSSSKAVEPKPEAQKEAPKSAIQSPREEQPVLPIFPPMPSSPATYPVVVPAPAPVVVPVPAPVPVLAVKPEEVQFKVHLNILNEMGFSDHALNIQLLKQHSGNMQQVVNHLFSL